ncbi:hypothetical protein UA08_09207 [Talaromyces atroroseus]|uniref:Major facilitator superfamily (MFS) profile domain-containing protein n=1 Tax=Talaromyces atroroseus TaxID=1441469 RepID=A0A1Q5Q707_TALAT|nr:hypothetical protein UA08_09207 [Talaromyces atroroseus]OKL55471.1 hypothetical protein UA08_09207 [Talaromyces atroroseus]
MEIDTEKTIDEHIENSTVLKEASRVPDFKYTRSPQERRLIWKQDLLIVSLLAGCFFFAYLDRTQIGNARIMGLEAGLGISSSQYFNVLMMFYVGYMVFELPAALILRYLPPPVVFGFSVVLFGVISCSVAAVHSYGVLMFLRVFLGLFEAVVQTGNLYLAHWYYPNEVGTRSAFFYLPAPIAGAVGGLIAYGVQRNLENSHGIPAWRWLFIIEGAPTIFWGLLVVALLPNFPETVAKKRHWLFRRHNEREMILQRCKTARNEPGSKAKSVQVWLAIKDPKSWLQALVVGAVCLNVAAFGTFLPTFIQLFGFSALTTQVYTIIPYAFGVVTLPIGNILADRYDKKGVPTLICLGVCLIGYILLLSSTNKVVLIAGCCFVSAGAYPAVILSSAWVLISNAGYTKRATAWAIAQIFIQCYSIISTQVYTDPPRFFKGHGTLLGLNALGVVAVMITMWIFDRENKRRDIVAADFAARGEINPDSNRSYEDLCDKHPDFRYTL